MKILLIDNYDSFTYNLVQHLGSLGSELEVQRNDAISVADVMARNPDAIVLSPGPCTPREAGICVPLVKEAAGKIPLLGVCLGHQAIGEAFGGHTVRAKRVMHGKTSNVQHSGKELFAGLPSPISVMRYHSLVVDPGTLPNELEVTATAQDNPTEIHAVRHREHPVWGVQFHPESVLTPQGMDLLRNFLTLADTWNKRT
ncbi:MAG TPA: aminodeoxychorismate/anthranilate synthase component II [Gemmatimonadaceae bacterium]|nr:aminodeoxychorismate/anthranilate synthase component II [Gemmatimonadaceae bacterium]